MTTATDAEWEAFIERMPARARYQVNGSIRAKYYLHRALTDHGWTIEQLAQECSRDTADVRNLGGIVTHRLERCSQAAPSTKTALANRPFCSPDCEQRRGLIEDPKTGLPIGKCECRSAS
jgi:hypothetical protein